LRPIHYEIMGYFYMMYGCFQAMPAAEKLALAEWERIHMDGRTPTTAWPGWKKYIGLMPSEPQKPSFKKIPIPPELRMKVFRRDGFKCVKCGGIEFLTADHIQPESKGGTQDLDNLQTLCKPCNCKKGAKIEGKPS
jgi:hypothetical protein